jgi:hypothetical protein
VSVPDEAASGKAKVTLSFPDWKEAKIAPATFEITVVDVSPEEEAREEREQKLRAEQSRRIQMEMLPRHIKSLRKQLEKVTDPKKRQQCQELIEQLEKQLRDIQKPEPDVPETGD